MISIRVAERMGRGGAGGAGRRVRPFGAEPDRDLSGRQIDDGGGNEKGRDLPRATVEIRLVLALDGGEPADARRDEHADSRGVVGRHLQSRVGHRAVGRRDGELDEDVHLLDVLLLDERQRVEILDFAGDPGRERRRIEPRDRSDATLAGDERRPVRFSTRCRAKTPTRCP